jgi:hypothetical protein
MQDLGNGNISTNEIVNRNLLLARCWPITVEAKNNRLEV